MNTTKIFKITMNTTAITTITTKIKQTQLQPNNDNNITINITFDRLRKKLGIFAEFDFLIITNRFTKSTSSIFQFEARHFQYSLLDSNICICKDYRQNIDDNCDNNSSNSRNNHSSRRGKHTGMDCIHNYETICVDFGYGFGVNGLSNELLDLLIENANKFAHRYPDTVFTQAYIDDRR